jgi:hypothetical protein
MAAFLRQVGRRQIDGDPPRGSASPEAISAERTRSRASDTAVWQSHDRKRRQARCYLHLHIDRAGFDPLKATVETR